MPNDPANRSTSPEAIAADVRELLSRFSQTAADVMKEADSRRGADDPTRLAVAETVALALLIDGLNSEYGALIAKHEALVSGEGTGPASDQDEWSDGSDLTGLPVLPGSRA